MCVWDWFIFFFPVLNSILSKFEPFFPSSFMTARVDLLFLIQSMIFFFFFPKPNQEVLLPKPNQPLTKNSLITWKQ